MTPESLAATYMGYIACLNRQDWDSLGHFVHDDVDYNGQRIGLSGYRQMLTRDFLAIPDLRFNVVLLVAQPPSIASRLAFDCTPSGVLFGLPVHGKRVQFAENVFYTFADGTVRSVWSIIDKSAIAEQVVTPA